MHTYDVAFVCAQLVEGVGFLHVEGIVMKTLEAVETSMLAEHMFGVIA